MSWTLQSSCPWTGQSWTSRPWTLSRPITSTGCIYRELIVVQLFILLCKSGMTESCSVKLPY